MQLSSEPQTQQPASYGRRAKTRTQHNLRKGFAALARGGFLPASYACRLFASSALVGPACRAGLPAPTTSGNRSRPFRQKGPTGRLLESRNLIQAPAGCDRSRRSSAAPPRSANACLGETVRRPDADQPLTDWVQGIPLAGGRDSARLIRFCGLTRIMPWRGESMSATSMNAIEPISGRIRSNLDPALAPREP